MERKVGVVVCCLLAVVAGALPAMGDGCTNTQTYPLALTCHTAPEPVEGVLAQRWGDSPGFQTALCDAVSASASFRVETVPTGPYAVVVYEQTAFPTETGFGVWYEATVTMRNTGLGTWTKADGYRLVCRNDPPDLWTTTEVLLDDADAIAPGQEKTFRFQMRGPSGTGLYYPAWSMAMGDLPFGEITNQPRMVAPGGHEPCISEQNVVYSLGAPGVLYSYDLGTGATTQLTSGDTDDHFPEISASTVAYTSMFPDGHYAISVLDLSTGAIRRFDVGGTPGPPDTDGSYVVWASTIVSETESHTHLFLLDVSTGQVTELDQDVRDPRISRGRIAYVQTIEGTLRIYDVAQSKVTAEFLWLPLACSSLDIYGDLAALLHAKWGADTDASAQVAFLSALGDGGVYASLAYLSPDHICDVRMSGEYLVWFTYWGWLGAGPVDEIGIYDLATGVWQYLPFGGPNLSICGTKVAWNSFQSDGDVYTIDLGCLALSVLVVSSSAVVVPEKTAFPTPMAPEQWAEASATMRNTGTDTWTKAGGYRLLCRNDPPDLWTTTEVPLDEGDAIAQGQEKTFHFLVRAPQEPGSYLPQWSMAIGTVVFGETTGTQSVTVTEDAGFPDVPAEDWAYDEIMACASANVVKGYEDGSYRPEFSVTRDQMAVYVSRALVLPSGDAGIPDPESPPSFSDVPSSHWAYSQTEYAVSQGVVQGYADGTYHPAFSVTRDQMAVYIARSLVAPGGEPALADYVPSDPRNFPDVPSDFWAYKQVEYCVGQGVVRGYDDGLYHPEGLVTRDQMAVYIARAFGLL
jgi:hypothetical protein